MAIFHTFDTLHREYGIASYTGAVQPSIFADFACALLRMPPTKYVHASVQELGCLRRESVLRK
jgi:hypothetical protein